MTSLVLWLVASATTTAWWVATSLRESAEDNGDGWGRAVEHWDTKAKRWAEASGVMWLAFVVSVIGG